MVDIFVYDPRLFHVLIGLFALIIWSNRDVRRSIFSISADVVGVITILIALLFVKEFIHLFTQVDAKAVTKWFIFYLAISFWTVPIFTALGAWFFGRIIGRILRKIRNKFS